MLSGITSVAICVAVRSEESQVDAGLIMLVPESERISLCRKVDSLGHLGGIRWRQIEIPFGSACRECCWR